MLVYGIGYWIRLVIFRFRVKCILKVHLETNFKVSLKPSLKYSCNTPEYTFKPSTLSSPTYSRTYHDLFFSSKRTPGSQSGKKDLHNESQESRPCVLCIYTYQLLIQHGMRITYWYVFDCRIDILEHDGFTVIAHSLTAHIGKLWPKKLPKVIREISYDKW